MSARRARSRGGAPVRTEEPLPGTTGALAVRLLALAREAGPGGLVHVAGSERRADALVRVLRGLDPGLVAVHLNPWDCLPYDRASPSREAMGRRIAALRAILDAGDAPRVLVATPDALLQRIPPREAWARAELRLEVGGSLDPAALEAFLDAHGYRFDERVDEPGEAAIRGQVVEVFPPGAARPCRIEHGDGRIGAIRAYDPVSQRSVEEVREILVLPATEAIPLPPPEERGPGFEHRLPERYPRLDTVLDLLPGALVAAEPKAEARREAAFEQLADAHQGRLASPGEGGRPLPVERLYLTPEEWEERLAGHRAVAFVLPDGEARDAVPAFAAMRSAARGFAEFLEEQAGRRIVLAAQGPADARALARRAREALGRAPEPASSWREVLDAAPDALLSLPLDLDEGFLDEGSGTVVIAGGDLLGSRAAAGSDEPAPVALAFGDGELAFGDAVIHLDYGMGVLSGLDRVATGESASEEAAALSYAGDARLLVPASDLDRVWRYGSEAEAVSLDRLDGEAWAKRRGELWGEIAAAARGLVALAREREGREAPRLVPPRRAYERFAARFPFAETADQARAIADTLADLASGKPMDRLVCGDVGFGKTEVALRAAAAAALSGKQVAIVAPTTVLVRQHLRTVRRRFAGLGIEVGHLSRLAKPAEARAVKAGLKDGSIRVVVGTHALAAKGVAFHDLGLLVVDEEQRFGAAQKARLRALAGDAHVLTLTATPIPRTLQSALVGLQSLSLITTPPARRRPIRTFLSAFDPVTVREALIRERARGGQSFLVCPRVEDIAPMAERLKGLVPELQVFVAHGRMPAEETDEAMVRFADGEGDVLLATNIIESGLDVPRANTMLVWRADRFGLSQLHQIRGRVGRGRVQGVCYLLTDPEAGIAPATAKRLSTLEALDRLGAGFAVSARDLDLRGAGDLLGDEQAGHVRLIGSGLYQHLLERALREARGEEADDWTPELHLGLSGGIPEEYIPEPEVRLNLYMRLARLPADEGADAIEDEIADRFGPPPPPVRDLVALARFRRACRRLGIARIDAGPQAVALTFRPGAAERPGIGKAVEASDGVLAWKGERLIYPKPSETPEERRALVGKLLRFLGRRR